MPGSRPHLNYEDFRRDAGAAHAAMTALGKAIEEGGLDKSLAELIKLRASQINGCAFCLQLHLNKAREIGISVEKLDLVGAWRETSGTFSERENAALGWTEALTRLSEGEGLDLAYSALALHFDEREILFLTMAIGMINQWNRIAVAFRFPPPVPRRGGSAA
jgi:AhpD family alkylhydroperoxidase